jgi:adenylosuccinate synthase
VTKLDVLDGLDELKIATHYCAGGETLDDFPGDLALLEDAKPEYESLPGWSEKTSEARRWEDLPEAAHRYLRRLEELTGVRIWYVSVGTRRDQIIHVAR